MYLERLSARGFRNLAPLDLTLGPTTLVLRGTNGQGKTNLLEAAYLAATGRSFRHAAPREMVDWHGAAARVDALFSRREVRHEVSVKIENGRRSLAVDGRSLQRTARLFELVNVVSFFPDDLRIVKGEPELRRRFLDRAVAGLYPPFVEHALAYARALRARNALLKQRAAVSLIRVYDEQLVVHGAALHDFRVRTLEALLPKAAHRFAALTRLEAELTVRLSSGLAGGENVSSQDYAGVLRQELSQSLARDLARGSSSVGPHRSDLVLALGGHEARLFASQGQQRAFVLALKLAEVDLVREGVGDDPILLLDDVSSELDEERTRYLFANLEASRGQVWLTTTGTVQLPFPKNAMIFQVDQGQVVRS